jgi:hypothetical protein
MREDPSLRSTNTWTCRPSCCPNLSLAPYHVVLLRADIGCQGKKREDHFLLVVNRCFGLLRVFSAILYFSFFNFLRHSIEKAQVETPVTVW